MNKPLPKPPHAPEMGYPHKPNFGQPCNGCGVCCVITPCSLALAKVEGAEPKKKCPALEKMAGYYQCGLMANPKKYAPKNEYEEDIMQMAAKLLIGSGNGCDCTLKGEYRSQTTVQLMELASALTFDPLLASLGYRVWGVTSEELLRKG